MLHDLRHAFRMLLHTKGWTAVVLLSLALGIGANVALFTAVNGLLLQTVAVPNPESLVRLKWYGDNDMMRSSSDYGFRRGTRGSACAATFSYATYQAIRASTQTTDATSPLPRRSLSVQRRRRWSGRHRVQFRRLGQLLRRVAGARRRSAAVIEEADDQPARRAGRR